MLPAMKERARRPRIIIEVSTDESFLYDKARTPLSRLTMTSRRTILTISFSIGYTA